MQKKTSLKIVSVILVWGQKVCPTLHLFSQVLFLVMDNHKPFFQALCLLCLSVKTNVILKKCYIYIFEHSNEKIPFSRSADQQFFFIIIKMICKCLKAIIPSISGGTIIKICLKSSILLIMIVSLRKMYKVQSWNTNLP